MRLARALGWLDSEADEVRLASALGWLDSEADDVAVALELGVPLRLRPWRSLTHWQCRSASSWWCPSSCQS